MSSLFLKMARKSQISLFTDREIDDLLAPGIEEEPGDYPVDIRALSLINPWANLVARGIKPVENRPKPLPPHLEGQVVLIHASSTAPKKYGVDAKTFLEERALEGITWPEKLSFGGIVGWAIFKGCIHPSGVSEVSVQPRGAFATSCFTPSEMERLRPWWMPGQYGYVIQECGELPFVPCKGTQGWWRVPSHIQVALSQVEGGQAILDRADAFEEKML